MPKDSNVSLTLSQRIEISELLKKKKKCREFKLHVHASWAENETANSITNFLNEGYCAYLFVTFSAFIRIS